MGPWCPSKTRPVLSPTKKPTRGFQNREVCSALSHKPVTEHPWAGPQSHHLEDGSDDLSGAPRSPLQGTNGRLWPAARRLGALSHPRQYRGSQHLPRGPSNKLSL